MNKRVFFGVKLKELLVVFLFYFLFCCFYVLTLWLNRAGYNSGTDSLFNMNTFVDTAGLQYCVFFIFSVPIWFIVFKWLRKKTITIRLAVHLLLMPLFVYGSQQFYYYFSEFLGFGHLRGAGQVWDIYIPSLFYIIQFGILHAYEYFIDNRRKLLVEGELRQAALKSELAAIKAQLNPHFLYNVFNTINASVPPENEKTRNMIAQLSDLFRYQLKASKTELVTLGDELEFVQKYLELEKERFKDRLHIDIKVSKDLMSEKIPPMLLQPIVENSVKHGLASLIEGGTISIYIFKEDGKLKFEISDTGIGIKDKQKVFNQGIGLTNTRLRLQKMYQSQLELLDNSPQGLTVKFAI